MKVELNLSLAQGFRQRHLLAWSLPLFLVSLVALFRMSISIRTNWIEYRSAHQAVEREEGRRNELAVLENGLKLRLDQPENQALLHEVQYVNYLIDQRRLSFSELALKVTGLLPPEVRLTGLGLPDAAGDPVVRFSVEGASEGPVETFLSNLEDSADFRDVTVTSQGFEEKGNGAPVSIGCTARYVGGRAQVPAQELPRQDHSPKTSGKGPADGKKATSSGMANKGPVSPAAPGAVSQRTKPK
ncbi:MAG TPA: hypothetical protein VI455_20040 [Terriglobia bacterium]